MAFVFVALSLPRYLDHFLSLQILFVFLSLTLRKGVYLWCVCACVCARVCVGYTVFTTCSAAIPGSVVAFAVLSLLFFPFPHLFPVLQCVCARARASYPSHAIKTHLQTKQSTTFLRTWAHARTACARAHSFHKLKTHPSLTRPSLKTHQVHEEALCDGVGMAMAVKQRIEARVRGLNGRLASWLRVLFFCCVEQREHLLQDVLHRPRYLHMNQSKHTT